MASLSPERDELEKHLHSYNEHPERRAEITAAIEARFTKTLAIVVIDSSSFTRTVHESGIIHFLALLERLARLIIPVIERNGGKILKRDADNFFATFADPDQALRSVIEIQRSVAMVNEALPAAEEIYVAIGVGFGSVLALGEDDLFGDEMNLACKLGEDLAEGGEIPHHRRLQRPQGAAQAA